MRGNAPPMVNVCPETVDSELDYYVDVELADVTVTINGVPGKIDWGTATRGLAETTAKVADGFTSVKRELAKLVEERATVGEAVKRIADAYLAPKFLGTREAKFL